MSLVLVLDLVFGAGYEIIEALWSDPVFFGLVKLKLKSKWALAYCYWGLLVFVGESSGLS